MSLSRPTGERGEERVATTVKCYVLCVVLVCVCVHTCNVIVPMSV